MSAYFLTIPDNLPPSLNTVGSRGHWRSWQTAKKLWEQRLVTLLRDEGVPAHSGAFAKVTAILTVPDKRRRDAGNYGALLEKSCGDALVRAGILPDDTPEHWSWTSVTFAHVPREKATTVIVELEWADALDVAA